MSDGLQVNGAMDEQMLALFLHGPTFDGDLISKDARDGLVAFGKAARYEGYNYLTEEGVRASIARGFDREKERRAQR